MKLRVILIALFVIFLFPLLRVNADEYDDVTKQLNDLKHLLELSQRATATNEQEFKKLTTQLTAIKTKVVYLESEIVKKEKEVKEGEKALIYQKKLLDQRAISYYKNLSKNSLGVMEILVTDDLTKALQNFFYQKTLQDEDRRTITKIVLYIKNLEDKKVSLETETGRLSLIKQEVDKQSQFLAGEVSKSKKYESELKNKIVDLSSKQQALLAQKINSIQLPRSAETSLGGCFPDVDLSGGNVKDPGFGPKFAFFSFGVPNKIGMNQYGAYGRSKSGQGYEDILRAYYNFENLQDFDVNTNINVDGYGTYSLEDYVKRIYEVPSSWGDNGGMEALKAQAIAARSYVLAYTNKGAGSICTTEQCQVFQPQEKGGNWNLAVEATRGKVMIQEGQPIKAWFSSTHGGVILSSGEIGWSSTSWTKHGGFDASGSVNNFSDLKSLAFDRDSKWFYCDWGYRSQYNNTAWLKSEEVADIANAYMLYSKDKSTTVHLGRTDSSDVPDTWNELKVREELRSRGESPFESVNNVEVVWDSSGISRTINIDGRSFNAQIFKNVFNLRAPANIQIKPACKMATSSDIENVCLTALFNVEKR